jgi:hypothetical protein
VYVAEIGEPVSVGQEQSETMNAQYFASFILHLTLHEGSEGAAKSSLLSFTPSLTFR